jgi:PAS domain S-box-containing protein
VGTRPERFRIAAALAVSLAVLPPIAVGLALREKFPDWRWQSPVLHASIEAASAIIALGLASVLLWSWRRRGQHLLWMAAALIGMAIAEIAHACMLPGDAFVWFRSLATLWGGSIGALVWLPERIAKRFGSERWILGVSIAAMGVIVIVSGLLPATVPRMIGDGGFTPLAIGMNAIGGAGFVAAAARFLRYPGNRLDDPSLAMFAALCGTMGLVFGLSSLWDATWWEWHALQFFAALAAFSGSVMMYGRAGRELEREVERRRAAQRSLAYSKAQLAAVLDSVGEGIVSVRPDGEVVMANGEARRIWHCPGDRMLGMQLSELMPPEYRQRHREALRRTLDGGEATTLGRRFEAEGLREDGSRFPLEICVVETRIGPERLFTAAVRDITGRLRAQAENERLNASLIEKERLAAMGETAAVFAHEVGNPLNAMALNVHLLRRRLASDASQGAIEGIEREVARLTKLLGDFRSLARRDQIEIEPLELGTLVADLLASERERHERARLAVQTQIDPDVPLVRGDPAKLRQVLLNLLSNASDAMPDGGLLRVEVAHRDRSAVVRISDTGAGIPDGVDVFELFYTTKPQGTGLGLGIARRLVHAHGGSLRYESEPGRGTTFCLELPAARPDHTEPAPEEARADA